MHLLYHSHSSLVSLTTINTLRTLFCLEVGGFIFAGGRRNYFSWWSEFYIGRIEDIFGLAVGGILLAGGQIVSVSFLNWKKKEHASAFNHFPSLGKILKGFLIGGVKRTRMRF